MERAAAAVTVMLILLVSAPLVAAQPVVKLRGPEWGIAGIDVDGDSHYEVVVELNHWNLESASGSSLMYYFVLNRTVYYTQDLYNFRYKQHTVYGYPELFYGYKPWNGWLADDGDVKLPAPVKSLGRLWVAVNYTLSHQPGLPINLALDLWLTRTKKPRSVGRGDAEIMVWLYHSNLRPAGSPIGGATCPAYLDGKPTRIHFTLWSAEFSWRYLAFVADTPRRKASLSIDLTCLISYASKKVQGLEELYLEDVELGTEYGLPGTRRAVFSWKVTRFTVTSLDPEKPLPLTFKAVDTRGNPLPGIPLYVNGHLVGVTGSQGSLTVHLKPGHYTFMAPLKLSGENASYVFSSWMGGREKNYIGVTAGVDSGATAVYSVESSTEERAGTGGGEGGATAPPPSKGLSLSVTSANIVYLSGGRSAVIRVTVKAEGGGGCAHVAVEAPSWLNYSYPGEICLGRGEERTLSILVDSGGHGGSASVKVIIRGGRNLVTIVNNLSFTASKAEHGETAGEKAGGGKTGGGTGGGKGGVKQGSKGGAGYTEELLPTLVALLALVGVYLAVRRVKK